jgi:hypothetical protein
MCCQSWFRLSEVTSIRHQCGCHLRHTYHFYPLRSHTLQFKGCTGNVPEIARARLSGFFLFSFPALCLRLQGGCMPRRCLSIVLCLRLECRALIGDVLATQQRILHAFFIEDAVLLE